MLISISGMIVASYFFYRAQNPPKQTISESEPSQASQTVVEELPPEVVPVESPTPQPMETAPKTVVAPPAEPSPVDWLRDHQDRWPQEVELKEAMVFPAKRFGQVIGSVKVPARTRAPLMSIQADTVVVAYAGGTNRVPITATDLESRAKAEMANAKPASTPSMFAAMQTPGPSVKPQTTEEAAAEGKWKSQFKAGTGTLGNRMGAPTPRAETGHVDYTLHKAKDPTPEQEKIDDGITKAMDAAISYYNRYTSLQKHINVVYSPGTPTADANFAGNMRLGGQRNTRTCLHEMGHCMGVGTHPNWGKLMVDHIWQGKHANKLLQEFTKKPDAQLHGDRMHVWPYGLNYDQEVKSEEDMIRHAMMVEAIVKDLDEAR